MKYELVVLINKSQLDSISLISSFLEKRMNVQIISNTARVSITTTCNDIPFKLYYDTKELLVSVGIDILQSGINREGVSLLVEK